MVYTLVHLSSQHLGWMFPVCNCRVENRPGPVASGSQQMPSALQVLTSHVGFFCPLSWAELRCSPSYPLLAEVVSKWDSLCWAHSPEDYYLLLGIRLWFICNLYWSLKFFFFFLLSCAAFGILVSQPRVEPGPQQWKHEVLTTGLPGDSWQISQDFRIE